MDDCSPTESSQPGSLTGTEKRCAHCDFINLTEADLCISCAEPLTGRTSDEKPRAECFENITKDTMNCPHCTFINKIESMVCSMCSKSLQLSAKELRDLNDPGGAEYDPDYISGQGYASDHKLETTERFPRSVSSSNETKIGSTRHTLMQKDISDSLGNITEDVPSSLSSVEDPKRCGTQQPSGAAAKVQETKVTQESCSACTYMNPIDSEVCEICSWPLKEASSGETSARLQMYIENQLFLDPGLTDTVFKDHEKISNPTQRKSSDHSTRRVEESKCRSVSPVKTSDSLRSVSSTYEPKELVKTSDSFKRVSPTYERRESHSSRVLREKRHARKTRYIRDRSGESCPSCCGPWTEQFGHKERYKDTRTCSRCMKQFCIECMKPYKVCSRPSCLGDSYFHCHHSRICPFSLRVYPAEKLQLLLHMHKCLFETYLIWAWKNDPEYRKWPYLSQVNYKLYLSHEIKTNALDPAEVMDKCELARIIERETDKNMYLSKYSEEYLRQYVQTRIPLM